MNHFESATLLEKETSENMMETCPEPSVIFDALRRLTTATSSKDAFPPATGHSTFEQLLVHNIQAFDSVLQTSPQPFIDCWKKDTAVIASPECSPKWMFVTYCLKCLTLLQKSLKQNIEKYKKKDHNSVNPSRAPVMSPDTLSFNDIKTIKTTLQFVVCLGICPYLLKGVGIPLELRSGFSEMVKLSEDGDTESVEEKSEKLCVCLKVLISCVFNPALGTTVLTQHFTDILAGLLQLIHVAKSKDLASPDLDKESVKRNTEKNKIDKLQDMTPASIVDKSKVIDRDKIDTEINSNKITNTDTNKIESDIQNMQEINVTSGDDISETGTTVKDKSRELEVVTKNEVVNTDNLAQHETNEPNQDKSGRNKPMVDVEYCEKTLEELLQKVYPPLVVKTLLMLQGGPRTKTNSVTTLLPPAPVWLRKICGQQLTGIVMRPKGVQSVLRGMLDVPGAGRGMTAASDWRKCDAVAKVIAHCPRQSQSAEAYFQKVGSQILELLRIKDKQLGREFLRVACSTVSNMATQQIQLARKYIIFPLLSPLLTCVEITEIPSGSAVVVKEADLSCCVEDCHKVFVCGVPDNPGLITNIQPVVLVLFQLLVFTKSGVSALRSSVQEILVAFLRESDLPVALAFLQLMTFQSSQSELAKEIPRMHQDLTFANGSSGGVMVVKSGKSDSETKEEVIVECVVKLLKDLSQSDVSGEFVVFMLNELTNFIQTEAQGGSEACKSQPGNKSTDSQSLLDVERQNQSAVDQFYRKLKLLNVLASVCEELGPTCIRSAKQTLEFVKATLERGVQVCKATEDLVLEVFESETLTMAMGLLTAVLTGAFKLTERDRNQMEELLPLLLEIGENHPDTSVQEMATDIRIAIATHGAVWSEVTKTMGKDFGNMTKKLKEEKKKVGKEKQRTVDTKNTQTTVIPKPKIEMLEESIQQSDKEAEKDLPKADVQQHSEFQIKDTSACVPSIKTEDIDSSLTNLSIQKSEKAGSIIDKKENETVTETDKDRQDKISETTGNEVEDLSKDTEPDSELEMCFRELCDPLIPVRGHGLIRLTKLVKNRDPSVLGKKQAVLKIFEENLDHPDSYLYLSAVNGLSAMCEVFPGLVLPKICEQFSNLSTGEGKKRSTELRMKLGEIIVKATRYLGETVPHYRDLLINTVLVGARDEEAFVRASSLSNLGDICKLLRFSLGNIVHEVFNCCSSLLKSDPDIQVRKAAGQAIVLLLQGMGENVFKILGSVLKDIYQLLKQVAVTETNDGVKVHVHMALEELDSIMKAQLFPEQKLEKRIRVRDFD